VLVGKGSIAEQKQDLADRKHLVHLFGETGVGRVDFFSKYWARFI